MVAGPVAVAALAVALDHLLEAVALAHELHKGPGAAHVALEVAVAAAVVARLCCLHPAGHPWALGLRATFVACDPATGFPAGKVALGDGLVLRALPFEDGPRPWALFMACAVSAAPHVALAHGNHLILHGKVEAPAWVTIVVLVVVAPPMAVLHFVLVVLVPMGPMLAALQRLLHLGHRHWRHRLLHAVAAEPVHEAARCL
mmetsp:Transcript_47006/g.105674  ORF Transcript_47006/g.105674 Transcript_47006/m.105674 type:complete len:201 (+) Transcript_47006:331-933(+)